MITDQEIASCVETVLRQWDPNSVTSVNGVVRQVEAKLGLDLSHKASFVRDQIDLLLRPVAPPPPVATAAMHHHLLRPVVMMQQHQQQQQMGQKDHFALLGHPQQAFQLHHQQPQQQMGPPPPFTLHHPHQIDFRCGPPPPVPGVMQAQVQQVLHHPVAKVEVTAASGTKESAPTGTKRRGGPGGLNKVCGVSPELQVIVGEPALPRTQIVKQLWAYIRKNNLQDPNNKRKIICDEPLRLVFETDCTDMFKMNKLLAKHILPLESPKDSGPDSKRVKTAQAVSPTENEAGAYPVMISDALAKFLGTKEKEMPQSEALKRVWDYIKNNQLEDPLNTMMIMCDEKLQQLFGCESLSALGVSEMLTRHLFKQS
ncbi:hypothetical protein QJS04_geneDACA022681 [Acorus gramineus]|uniref:DM2 domain-containing protein n=1 Tax=Acorus gramineus TaxID=55184 RepID=A0AAV9BCS9_ACOGR|nr:hypothetical protein QJS04_geneDACA022681 [Acorus gramineus]